MFSRVVAPVVLALGAVLMSVEAQQAAAIPRVGFLSPVGHSSILFEQFRQGLAGLGYVEGQNIILEPRFADGQYERVPELAAELARLEVNVIAMHGDVTVRAAGKVVTNTPMVFAIVADPVAEGIVADLERPGGNITGVTTFDPQQARKQIKLLKQTIPGLRRIALLGDQGVSEALMKANEEQARALGLRTQVLRVGAPSPDLEGAFAAIGREHAGALLILEEPLIGIHRKRIVELAVKNHLPTASSLTHADAGSLVAYGTSLAEGIRRMAVYVDKILKGARPGELPVETVKHDELIVNLKTAREIGVTIPPEVLKRADRVIQ